MPVETTSVVDRETGLGERLERLAEDARGTRPLATYRLQFNHDFTFTEARRLVPYLASLGITHCYASPLLKARANSPHGYDITDHNAINPEIGSEEDFRGLVADLRRHGMGLVLDIVPNHMGVGSGDNPWWQDVLENGETSPFAAFFDIDWEPLKSELQHKLLLPVLGGQYGEELEAGHIQLQFEQGRISASYFDKKFPLDPQTVPILFDDLRPAADEEALDAGAFGELRGLLAELRGLPTHSTSDPEEIELRQKRNPVLLHSFSRLAERSEELRHWIEGAIRVANGIPGEPRSFDILHRLLEAQVYRLADWRVSAEEINYRRFFDINNLVGLRMETPAVFAETHRLVRRLLADGSIDGLRIDHPDGLLNPRQYLTRLQLLYAAARCCGPDPQPPLAENGIEEAVQEAFRERQFTAQRPSLPVVVEKILEPGEELPPEWPVDGTVGYEFANALNGVFIDGRSRKAFSTLYHRFTGLENDVDRLVYESKLLIMRSALSSEVNVLTHLLERISGRDRRARDFTRAALLNAIRETIACFPVYRTYIDERGAISDRDRASINLAIARAKRRNESTPAAVFDFLRAVLLLEPRPYDRTPRAHRARVHFTLKFQQLTGPVMAKGLEDTVCYGYTRLVSVNEVGGSPAEFGMAPAAFHAANGERQRNWPGALLATSTHDTKRSEDVRARINVLSEMPRAWGAEAMRWRRLNRARKRLLADGRSVPDFNEEYLLYQTLVGCWPFDLRSPDARAAYILRIQAYMTKAVHEAKVNLSWINPNPLYVEALQEFIAHILRPGDAGRRQNIFLQRFERFLPPLMFFGAINSLAQTVLKLAAPGVADLYQGTEMWDFSLVDPDNRRPIDFALRQRSAEELQRGAHAPGPLALCEGLLRDFSDGRIKQWIVLRALAFRRAHPELFQSGSYVPLHAAGSHAHNVIAFAREFAGSSVIAAVPRLSYTLMQGEVRPPLGPVWADTELPVAGAGEFENLFTGEVVRVAPGGAFLCRELFAHFPMALLRRL